MTISLPGRAWSHDKLKPLFTITTVLIIAKLGRVVTYHEKLLLLKLLDPLIMGFCEVTWLINYFISPIALDQWLPNMVIWWFTKRGVRPINSHNPLNMSSREITEQIKNLSPLSQCLWSQDLPVWWYKVNSSHKQICVNPQCGDHVRSRDKLNTLYLHLQKTHE